MDRPAAPARLRPFTCVVREVVRETADTVTLVLDAGAEPRDCRPGQFLSVDPAQLPELAQLRAFLEHEKGAREPVRAYSLASIPDDPHLAITVKEEPFVAGTTRYPPLLSPWLVRAARPGRTLQVTGFTGPYVLPDDVEARTSHVVHVAAGSGVVPNYAMLRWALAHRPSLRHTFVYSNKTRDDEIFGAALQALAASHPDRLRLIRCFTREPEAVAGCVRGRVGLEVLRDAIGDPSACLVYACGPALTKWEKRAARERGVEPSPRFLETVRALLGELGVPRSSIHTEAYG